MYPAPHQSAMSATQYSQTSSVLNKSPFTGVSTSSKATNIKANQGVASGESQVLTQSALNHNMNNQSNHLEQYSQISSQ